MKNQLTSWQETKTFLFCFPLENKARDKIIRYFRPKIGINVRAINKVDLGMFSFWVMAILEKSKLCLTIMN